MTDATYNLNGGFKPTAKRFADLEGPDFLPTPVWATHALIDNEKFEGDIWEPACGDGSMSRVLESTVVQSTDLFDRGYGEAGVDFLTSGIEVANIIPIRRTTPLRRLLRLALGKPTASTPCSCGSHSLKEPTALTPSSSTIRRRGSGCSASASRSIPAASSRRARARPPMRGSCGIAQRRSERN